MVDSTQVAMTQFKVVPAGITGLPAAGDMLLG